MVRRSGMVTALALLLVGVVWLTDAGPVDAQDQPRPGVQLQAGFTNVAYLGPTLPLPEALTNAAEEVTAVWSFTAGAGGPPWRLWSTQLPALLQGFDTLTYGQAYFAVSEAAVFWEYGAGEIGEPPSSVELLTGLNHVVYFGDTLPVEDALDGLEAAGLRSQQAGALNCVRLVWSFGATWTLWDPTLPPALLGFTQLVSGQSYFVAATEPCRWTFASAASEPPEPQAPTLDFGDAPDSYGTTTAADGARHTIVEGVFLGAGVDPEDDGQPTVNAGGDDVDADGDDEDGVQGPAQLTPGGSVSFQVVASTEGYLDAWIDFGGDGRFDEPGDRIFTSQPLVTGQNTLTVVIPPNPAAVGNVLARFRFSLEGGLGPTGEAPNGEVEDYGLALFDGGPPPVGCPPALIVCS